MHLRLLTSEDEPFLWTALYHAIHVPPGETAPASEIVRQPEIARYVSGWMRAGDWGVIAETDGVPLGAAWLRLWTPDERGYGFVDGATPELTMAVLPGHRGAGLGTLLLSRLLAEAAEHYRAVSLSVSSSNPAQRLYRRAGFTPVGRPEGGSVTMVVRLSAGGPVG